MKKEIEVIEYSSETGVQIKWEDGFTIKTRIDGNVIVIEADSAGLISIAQHLLTLAQPAVPKGYHFHYDDINSLEENSCEIIFEKL